MTDVIFSHWTVAAALGAACIGLLVFCFLLAIRLRGMKSSLNEIQSDSSRLKNGLVADLRDVLESAADRNIEAAVQHQERLAEHMAAALHHPLDGVAKSLQDFSSNQNAEIAQAVEKQMVLFADRLDSLLGSQVGNAKELQQQTVKSLEDSVVAVQSMSKTLSSTAESVTQTMLTQLRAGMSRSQAETDANLKELINKLGIHVANVIATIEQHAAVASRGALEEQTKISEQALRSIESLSTDVRTQSQAIESVAQSMRSAGTDVANAVDRIIEGMTGLMSGAAQEIVRSGQGFTEIFDKTSVLSHTMQQTATSLAASSRDLGVVVTDYRAARETLQGMVDVMRATADAARKDTTLAADFVARIEAAAQKLIVAQGQADQSVAKLKGVLGEVYSAFGAEMVETVRNFQEQLGKEPEQITDDSQSRHSEFDRMISDWVQTTPRLKPTKAGAQRERGEEKVLARAAGGRRSD
jgi:hypothetical protein